MVSGTDVYIFLFALFGVACLLWKNKRKFDRKNASGIEQFPKFRKKVGAQLFDILLWAAGIGCLLGSALVWVITYAEAWGWVALFLLIAFLIEKDYYRSK